MFTRILGNIWEDSKECIILTFRWMFEEIPSECCRRFRGMFEKILGSFPEDLGDCWIRFTEMLSKILENVPENSETTMTENYIRKIESLIFLTLEKHRNQIFDKGPLFLQRFPVIFSNKSYALRIESLKNRLETRKCELKFTSYEFKFQEFKFTN